MTREERIQKLKEYDDAYYNKQPIITDFEYDVFRDETFKLYPDDEYFEIVGAELLRDISEDKKITHKHKMLSLDKAKCIYLKDEIKPNSIERWINKIDSEGEVLIGMGKVDGLSGELYYSNRKLQHVVTRGNGSIGKNVTHLVKYVDDIPETIEVDGDIYIRGEIFLPKDTEFKPDTEEGEIKTLRNSASGLVGRENSNLEDLKYLRFVAYQVIGIDLEKEMDKLVWLAEQNFNTVDTILIKSLKEVEDFFNHYLDDLRDKWEYETDGLVFAINNTKLHKKIDSKYVVNRFHHYNISLKPPSVGKETTFIDIEWQVSRHGNIIPVGIIEPVNIGGATIQRVTLNNLVNVLNLNLHSGDKVFIERSNDVIPFFKKNLMEHDETAMDLIPYSCPSCDNVLGYEGVHLNCDDPECPEQNIQRLIYWVKKNDMDGVSEQTIRLLFENSIISKIKDLYNLPYNKIETLDGMGKKKVANLKKQIEKTKGMNIEEFLARLGINLVGEKAISKLNIKTINNFWKFDDSSYVIGQNIIEFRDKYEDEIKKLINIIGVIDAPDKIISKGKVCATGKYHIGRKELIKIIERKGYEFSKSVTKDTDILICEDVNGSSNKLKDARKNGTKIVSYEDFFN